MNREPVLSLGAGVQSSTVLLMAARGELDDLLPARPRLAIFADTKWEEAGTYEYLGLLRMEAWKGGIEIAEASAGDLREDVLTAAKGESTRASQPPLFTRGPDGRPKMTPRKCTRDYKIRPIRRTLRERGYGPQRPVEQLIGISLDEAAERMKGSDVGWVRHRWPLVDLRLTRHECSRWLVAHGYPLPPKSSCVGCPFHSDAYWRDMKINRPRAFAEAVEFDRMIRRLPGFDGELFLHRSLLPLDQVDFRNAEDHGQVALEFANECEGMCGV